MSRERHLALVQGFSMLLQVQERLQAWLNWPSGRKGMQMAKDNLLHTHTEVDEILNEIKWKPHKKYPPGEYGALKDRQAFITEITDAFQTLANVAIAYDVTAEELAQALVIKWSINFDDASLSYADDVEDDHG